jgi:hypothetical protein
MMSRRGFLGLAAVLASASAVSGRVQAASIPEAPSTKSTTMQPPIFPSQGPDYQPVVTLNGWTLPWRMSGDWKEFHLVAEPVVCEFARSTDKRPPPPGNMATKARLSDPRVRRRKLREIVDSGGEGPGGHSQRKRRKPSTAGNAGT